MYLKRKECLQCPAHDCLQAFTRPIVMNVLGATLAHHCQKVKTFVCVIHAGVVCARACVCVCSRVSMRVCSCRCVY